MVDHDVLQTATVSDVGVWLTRSPFDADRFEALTQLYEAEWAFRLGIDQ
jgi:hypothetical protein